MPTKVNLVAHRTRLSGIVNVTPPTSVQHLRHRKRRRRSAGTSSPTAPPSNCADGWGRRWSPAGEAVILLDEPERHPGNHLDRRHDTKTGVGRPRRPRRTPLLSSYRGNPVPPRSPERTPVSRPPVGRVSGGRPIGDGKRGYIGNPSAKSSPLPAGEGWGEGETPIGSTPLNPQFPGKSEVTQASQ